MAESGEGAVASAVPSDRADAALLIGLMVEQPLPAAAAKKQKKAEERFTPELDEQLCAAVEQRGGVTKCDQLALWSRIGREVAYSVDGEHKGAGRPGFRCKERYLKLQARRSSLPTPLEPASPMEEEVVDVEQDLVVAGRAKVRLAEAEQHNQAWLEQYGGKLELYGIERELLVLPLSLQELGIEVSKIDALTAKLKEGFAAAPADSVYSCRWPHPFEEEGHFVWGVGITRTHVRRLVSSMIVRVSLR